jgi:lysozyme family protein
MTPKCRACVDVILKHEGGYSDRPADPGNWTSGIRGVGELKGTMHGIAAASHPDLAIWNLTIEQCEAIYEQEYWSKMHGEDLTLPLALVTLDAMVMSGLGDKRHERAAGWLQEALGVEPDGSIGPQTIAAAASCDVAAVVTKACQLRLAFLQSLPNWSTFGKGWQNRVEDTAHRALLMAVGG